MYHDEWKKEAFAVAIALLSGKSRKHVQEGRLQVTAKVENKRPSCTSCISNSMNEIYVKD